MFKKAIGYILIFLGALCFLIVGGGSMRYRNRSVPLNQSIQEGIIIVLLYILIPIIGFFLLKIGFNLIGSKTKS